MRAWARSLMDETGCVAVVGAAATANLPTLLVPGPCLVLPALFH